MAGLYEAIQPIDEPSADLILQLQLEDVDDYSSRSKGKGREGKVSDESLALDLHREELESICSLRDDNRMARSIAMAVYKDAGILRETTAEEAVALRDRELARHWTDGAELPAAHEAPDDTEAQLYTDELLEKLRALYVPGVDGMPECLSDGEPQAESSAWAAGRVVNPPAITRHCEACREDVNHLDVASVPCGHEYCRDCLEGLFEASLADESLFPPRCCRQVIAIASVDRFVKSEVVRRFEKKKIEFETPNRIYCHVRNCSAFIPKCHIVNEVATCPDCGLTTCTICKAASHAGDCPEDSDLQRVLEEAKEREWQRCYNCRSVVELTHGCNHITCRCSAQFCYACGGRWKSCDCGQWDEHRLLERASQVVDREPEPLPEQNPGNQEPRMYIRNVAIAREVANLRANHECQHREHRRLNGSYQCETCGIAYNLFIHECRRCRLRHCTTCRRNRL